MVETDMILIFRFIQKTSHQRRLGLTETIDGLFDIPYPEYIVSAGNTLNDGILQFTCILKLINHDLIIAFFDPLSHQTMIRIQNHQSKPLQIPEIHACVLFLEM